MTNWPQLTLGEICAEGGGFIRTGPFGTQLHRSDYTDDPGGVPVLMPKDMAGGRVVPTSIARIDQHTANRLSQHLFEPGDFALSRRGDVGRSAWIAPDDVPMLCGTGSMRVHAGSPKSVRPTYLRYFFRSRLATDYLEGQAVGATMPNLNAGIVTAMPVPVLPIALQDAASSILSAIDELIDNNRRRIAVLKEVGEAIYREWFVHFRYPGHEHSTFVDSPMGSVPAGWRQTEWGEAAVLDYGRALRGYKDAVGEYPVFGTNGPIGRHHESRFPPGVIVGRKGAYRGIHYSASPCWVIDTAFYLRVLEPEDVDPLFAFHQLSTVDLDAIDSGSAIPSTSRDAFYAIPLVVPPANLMTQFVGIAKAIMDLQVDLRRSARVLAGIRDLILPGLVAGQVDVSSVDLGALLEGLVA